MWIVAFRFLTNPIDDDIFVNPESKLEVYGPFESRKLAEEFRYAMDAKCDRTKRYCHNNWTIKVNTPAMLTSGDKTSGYLRKRRDIQRDKSARKHFAAKKKAREEIIAKQAKAGL